MFVQFTADTVRRGLTRCSSLCHCTVLVMLVLWSWLRSDSLTGPAGGQLVTSPASPHWHRVKTATTWAGLRWWSLSHHPRWGCTTPAYSWWSPGWRFSDWSWCTVVIDDSRSNPARSFRSPDRNLQRKLLYWPNLSKKYALKRPKLLKVSYLWCQTKTFMMHLKRTGLNYDL